MTAAAQKISARAVADLSEGTVLATVDIAVPPERVFRALTTPEELVRWWGSDDLYRTTAWTADLRAGGKWRAEGKGKDGHAFSVEGEFLEVDPPSKLVQTWKPDWDAGHVTTITYRLTAIEKGTRVTVRHTGFAGRPQACQGHSDGWERVLGWLGGFLQPAEAPRADRFFFLRLLPPRPTFAMDMTAEEKAVMQEHAAYWTRHLQEGNVVVFGPVGDPKGPWGMGVIRAADEAAVRAFEAGDPAIRAERGFKYEEMPMLSAVFRQ
jgi:uncharacterized protein YndB with AHSA1/START domain